MAKRSPLSTAFLCPLAQFPDEQYLSGLHACLSANRHGKSLLQQISTNIDPARTWEIFASARPDVRTTSQGPEYLERLGNWATRGDLQSCSALSVIRSGIIGLPLLTILHAGQYFAYLRQHQLTHQEFLREIGEFGGRGGIQGYCGGLPAAIAIACAQDEQELVQNIVVIIRVLVGVGAYADASDKTSSGDKWQDGPTAMVVRLKYEGQGEELTSRFPGTYVSGITEPKVVGIVGPAGTLNRLYQYAIDHEGLQPVMTDVRGKGHNPENAQLATELGRLCSKTPALQLPHSSQLKVCVRSNRTGEDLRLLSACSSLTDELVTTILASKCEWSTLLGQVASDLAQTQWTNHSVLVLGYQVKDVVPLNPFHKNKLQISKIHGHGLIADNPSPPPLPHKSYLPNLSDDTIVIVSASCRLPGANSLEELWSLLASNTSCCVEVPTSRFDIHNSFRGATQCPFSKSRKFYGNFISNIDQFDNVFFGVNAREAASMDPQQRLLLELSFEALDAAGYLVNHDRAKGDDVGCFVGSSFVDYLDNTCSHPPTAYTSTGTIRAFLCGRISYYYGWSGPAEVIDSACSSSLVAIHRAVRAIKGGECRMALAGGMNLITGVNNYLDLAKANFLSTTGQCKPFDAAADGYCRADGAGLVVLKKLKDAIADGNEILGVVAGVATNQGGRSASITTPEPRAQQALYKRVIREAGIAPEVITYVEAHGTGTQAGDPSEIESIRAVFADKTASRDSGRQHELYIGSIKGNIGHTEIAAGVAGLLKVLAMLKHGQIPKQASFTRLNPKIAALEQDKLAISQRLRPWHVDFRASLVNSYGVAGSNSAMVCCEMPMMRRNTTARPDMSLAFPLLITAASEQGLGDNAQALSAYLSSKSAAGLDLGDVAFTLNEKRQRLKYRVKVGPCKTVMHAARQLSGLVTSMSMVAPQKRKAPVLVFSGQSDNKVALNRSFYQQFAAFRSYIDACDAALNGRRQGFTPLLPTAIFQTDPVEDIGTLQCGLFAVQYACAMCWIDAGLAPRAVMGHSLGELTALCVSGILSLPDAIQLVATRGRLVQTKWGPEMGTMLALSNCSDDQLGTISSFLSPEQSSKLEIACHNAATSLVAVGPAAVITAVEQVLVLEPSVKIMGIRSQRLATSHGFHSALVDPILPELRAVAESLTWNGPVIPFEACTQDPSSSLLTLIKSQPGTHVANHARQPVFFSRTVSRIQETLGGSGILWLEAGMDTPIINMTKKASAGGSSSSDATTDHFQAFKTTSISGEAISGIVADLWDHGFFLTHWSFLSAPSSDSRPRHSEYKQVWLPPYQFQKSRHWLDNVDRTIEVQRTISTLVSQQQSVAPVPPTPPPPPPKSLVTMKRETPQDPTKTSSSFTINTTCERFGKLVSGHRVRSRPLCPASLYMECATMAVQQLLPLLACRGGPSTNYTKSSGLVFEHLRFQAPLGMRIPPDSELVLQLQPAGTPPPNSTWTFTVSSHNRRASDPSLKSVDGLLNVTQHATGSIALGLSPSRVASSSSVLSPPFQRLVVSASDRILAQSSGSGASHLTSNLAYTLFSRVVTYSPIYRGMAGTVVTLSAGEGLGSSRNNNEAVATGIYLPTPEKQPTDGEESSSTARDLCDAVMLDVYVQVAGLLANTCGISNNSNEGEGEEDAVVVVMVGMDKVVLGPGAGAGSDTTKRVYAKLETVAVNANELVGDVFVLGGGEGENQQVLAMFNGCRFARVEVNKLERMLDVANLVKPSKGRKEVLEEERTARLEIAPPALTEPVLSAVDDSATGSSAMSCSRSSTNTAAVFTPLTSAGEEEAEDMSVDGDAHENTEMMDSARRVTLNELISEFAGLDKSEIGRGRDKNTTTLGDLGLDSLASIELAEQFSSKLALVIGDDEMLVDVTLADLERRLGLNKGGLPSGQKRRLASLQQPGRKRRRSASPRQVEARILAPRPETTTMPASSTSFGADIASSQGAGGVQARSDVLRIIAELAGVAANEISPSSLLSDVGIDSLTMVELQEMLEETFCVSLEDKLLGVECTVEQLVVMVGIDGSSAADTGGDSNTKPREPYSLNSTSTNKAVLAADINPFLALVESDKHFDESARRRNFVHYWRDVLPLQEKLTVAHILSASSSLGLDLSILEEGQQVPVIPYLDPSPGVAGRCERLVSRLWEILQKHEIVQITPSLTGDSIEITRGRRQVDGINFPPASHLLAQLYGRYAHFNDETRLVELTGPRLADCLAGKADAVSLMFGNPKASKIMADYYSQSPMLSTMTEQLVIFVTRLVQSWKSANPQSHQVFRILEVGAGTGGTTKRLAEALNTAGLSLSVQYTFTDISPGLVSKAKTRFREYASWMENVTLDLEKDMPERFRNRFHLIIGTNCVHATRVRENTCRRLKNALVQDGGALVLSEVTTSEISWYDITFGLLDGWWHCTEQVDSGGKKKKSAYPLQTAEWWMDTLKNAGYASTGYSMMSCTGGGGASQESNTQRLLVACTKRWEVPALTTAPFVSLPPLASHQVQYQIETIVYKELSGVQIHADVYFPRHINEDESMPIALMIHGGGHVTLSRKAIRPAQTRYLLSLGFLPVSIDYRLCPEVDLISGPIADVRSAYEWAQTTLPSLAAARRHHVNGSRVVVVGWSSGGHLACSLAWTARDAPHGPPRGVLSFYAPYDFESGELDRPRLPWLPGREMGFEQIVEAIPRRPITTYNTFTTSSSSSSQDERNLGWVRPGDPRSELLLSIFKEGNGLPILLHGLSSPSSSSSSPSFISKAWSSPPPAHLISAISTLARVRSGEYTVPTYVIHGAADEVAPVQGAERFVRELSGKGVRVGCSRVEQGKHCFDLGLEEGTEEWESTGIGRGYRFLREIC